MPGSFYQRSGESWRAPWADYARWRNEPPAVIEGKDRNHDVVVLSRFDDVFAAVRNTADFSSAAGLTFEPGSMELFDDRGRPIVMMDPPDHTVMRRLVSGPMSPSRISDFEIRVREFVEERLDRIDVLVDEHRKEHRKDLEENQGNNDSEPISVELVELLLKPLPSFAVAYFLGIPRDALIDFDRWTQSIVEANANNTMMSAAAAISELYRFAEELIAFRRTHPEQDLISDLAALDESVVTNSWIIGFIFTMVTGGNDTTTGLLGGSLDLLTEHRDQRNLLLAEPGLIRRSVEEFLRLTSPVQNLARQTTRSVTIGGVDLAPNQRVILLYGAANRDEREFGDDAELLRVTRPLVRHLSLGYGAHHCLGAAVARSMGTITLECLLSRFPDFWVDREQGTFASGPYVRRYTTLPFYPN